MFFCFGQKPPEAHLDAGLREQAVYKEDEYLQLYESAQDEQVCFDGTTAYLYQHDRVIEQMKHYYGDRLREVKIIIMLRNPVARAWSHYNYLIRNGFENLSFEQAIEPECMAERSKARWGFDYLGFGEYHAQVEAYLKHFDHVEICFMEELKNHEDLLHRLFRFVGIAPIEVERPKKANPSGVPKNRFVVDQLRKNRLLKAAVNLFPENLKHDLLQKRDKVMARFLEKKSMKPETKAALQQYYLEDIQKLSRLIDRDLSHWVAK